jgi:hypothetical protein
MTLHWRAVGRRGSKGNGQHFSDALLCGLRPRRGADCVRRPVWRQSLGAWPAPCGSLRHLCVSRSKTDCPSSAAPRSCCGTSRDWRRDIRTSLRSTNWRCRSPRISRLPEHGKVELHFPETKGEELHALAPSRTESGFRYSLSYSVSDLKILEDHSSKETQNTPA